jgi:aminoglycoside phosphotransferase family enzyme/predicted kinase
MKPSPAPHPSGPDGASELIAALSGPAAYPHPVDPVEVVETHISWVLLTGAFAYKIKKPVDYGFVNYSTLERRRHFCEEEIRLNRRLAPDLYIGVVPITGDASHPKVDGAGAAIEYAVKMREFPQDSQLDRVLARGLLGPEEVDELADTLARFHAGAPQARPGDGYGGPDEVAAVMRGNFELTAKFVPGLIGRDAYAHLKGWTDQALARHRDTIASRLTDGFVRECHGDVHLRNVALIDGKIEIFDCIEFNPAYRFTDVMAEVAFTQMDFDARDHPGFGWRFIGRYLERTGDYAGLALLPMYLAYRAYVRAKVTALGPDGPERRRTILRQVALAEGYTRDRRPGLLIMHGVTGSGKSTLSDALLMDLGCVRIRSDVERKRIAGVGRARKPQPVGGGIYSADMTRTTYARLHELAAEGLKAGYTVILDATYLKGWQRQAAREVAEAQGAPWWIVHCRAPREELIYRIESRIESRIEARLDSRAAEGGVSDGTVDVLKAQLDAAEPLTEQESGHIVLVDTDQVPPEDVPGLVRGALGGAPGRHLSA